MFIKRKVRAGKAYASRMFLSFKTSVTFIKNVLISRRTTVSVAKHLSSDKTLFFAGSCPMSGASIQA